MQTEASDLRVYRFVVSPRLVNDPRSAGILADAHALGLTAVNRLVCQDLYFIEGTLDDRQCQRLATELLSDPVTQNVEWGRFFSEVPGIGSGEKGEHVIEVGLRPGVTDPVAEQIVRASAELGITGVGRASTGWRFAVDVEAKLSPAGQDTASVPGASPLLHLLAKRLLANTVIHRYAVGSIDPVFPHPAEASGRVEMIPVRELEDDELMAVSRERRAALDLAEMQAIQHYYRLEGRDPTDIEFEMIAQTWSEHCVHKTFKAKIEITDFEFRNSKSEIDGLLRTYIRAATEKIAAPWVRSAFSDNAGIIDFDDEYEVSFKVETHNHPSAIEPFGGANTGVGGVIRDVLGVSAKPIANTDILCFGPQDLPMDELPEGVLHPRRIQSGVVAGVQDYGNKIGIPTVNGAILYDPGYTANPLVYCGCVGIAPKDSHPRQPQRADRVIVLGGGTGRDGLRGATFSSMTMDAQTGEVSGASVQIGDPITEKGLIEVLLRARDQKLYHAVTDCGAGGLSSAVGEMASQIGADVELKSVRLKYAGLAPWEIWLSEAQERMVFAVPPQHVAQLQAICDIFDVNLTDIGEFTGSGRLVVRYNGKPVLDVVNEFLHEGIPQRQLKAIITHPVSVASDQLSVISRQLSVTDYCSLLTDYLSSPNIASKSAVIRLYDHEVQGGTVVKPLTGVCNDGPSDACVLKPIGTKGVRGIVLSNGINPEYGKLDAYNMAVSVIDEAIRNAVAVGADPEHIALLDNFCWGDPLRPETLGSLVEACRGCYEAAVHYGTPFISGKDSLNNEYLGSDGQRHAIPPSLLISAIGLIDDVNQTVTMDLKEAGNQVYLVGEFQPAVGGAYLNQLLNSKFEFRNSCIPGMPRSAPALYRTLHAAMSAGLVRACHDLSEGGVAVAAAEMCIGGRAGLSADLPTDDPVITLFGETNGCFLIEVRECDRVAFEDLLAGAPFQRIGIVTHDPTLTLSTNSETRITIPVSSLVSAWNPQSSQ